MPMENGKWRVVRGDSLWNIAQSVYKDPYKWRDIASANGISQSTALIYPGNLLTLPGRTPSPSPTPAPTPVSRPPVNVSKKVAIQWFALDSGTDRAMFCTWTYDRANTLNYDVRWEYNTGSGGWRSGSTSNVTIKQSAYSAPAEAKRVRVRIKPIAKDDPKNNNKKYWTDGEWVTKEYNYANNPPLIPPMPTFEISIKNVLTARIENIQTDINADSIEFVIYKNDTSKFKTVTATINKTARFVSFTTKVDPGATYKIRCRAKRGSVYGGYTDYTATQLSLPVAPSTITTLRSQTISEQQSTAYAVFAEWQEVKTAKTYMVEWATNVAYFGTSQSNTQQTEEGKGPRLLIPGIELGYRYYFRVASINDKGQSANWSSTKSVILGTKPSAPTTYSNVVSCIVGEDLNLYWVHNSTDGSYESYARLQLKITDSANPSLPPTIITKVIKNTKPEEEKNRTSVYTINTSNPEFATIGEGFVIKWKVQTAGVTSEYSDWSTERQVVVYAKPEVEIDILNNLNLPVDEVNVFPFYISVAATPPAQVPISYYVEIVSNDAYQTVDDMGKTKIVNIGDKIYQKYYDPQINPWSFLLEMTPGNLDLENGMSYTINVTVAMDSGLTANDTKSFISYFEDLFYDVYADVDIDRETMSASIHPYCNETLLDEETEEETTQLVENCTLSIFRREYDGTFTEIASGVNNEENLWVTDPHPSLDFARYRIVAKMNNTGAISYGDIKSMPVNEVAAIIQWAEEWSAFEVDPDGDGGVEPDWAGSMLKIPYNITISDNKAIDVALIKYAGREHPVSYYGTHIGETSSWTMEIPKEDKELLYAVRRLSRWTGDVYVREPYGTGYWANITVSYNIKYSDVIVPVSMSVTRVEGGM